MNLVKSNIALLILAGVLAVPTAIQLVSDAESYVDYSSVPVMFPGFTAENVGYIAIGKPKDPQPEPNPAQQQPGQKPPIAYDQLNLQRSDKGWVIGQARNQPNDLFGAPVMTNLVTVNVFDHLARIRMDEQTVILPDAKPEKLEEYGLDEAHAKVVVVKDRAGQNTIAQLYVGKNSGGRETGAEAVRGVFVRRSDSNDVVLYEFEKSWFLEVDVDRWIDRTLLTLAPETVTRLAITNASTGGEPIVFERQDNQASWSCASPPAGRGGVRQTEVENFVQRHRHIGIQGYRLPLQRVGNRAQLGLLPPQLSLELTYTKDGEPHTSKLEVGSKLDDDENLRYLVSSDSQFLMTWAAAAATPLEVDVPANWFDPAGPPKAPEGPGGGDDQPEVPVKSPDPGEQKAGEQKAGGGK